MAYRTRENLKHTHVGGGGVVGGSEGIGGEGGKGIGG